MKIGFHFRVGETCISLEGGGKLDFIPGRRKKDFILGGGKRDLILGKDKLIYEKHRENFD